MVIIFTANSVTNGVTSGVPLKFSVLLCKKRLNSLLYCGEMKRVAHTSLEGSEPTWTGEIFDAVLQLTLPRPQSAATFQRSKKPQLWCNLLTLRNQVLLKHTYLTAASLFPVSTHWFTQEFMFLRTHLRIILQESNKKWDMEAHTRIPSTLGDGGRRTASSRPVATTYWNPVSKLQPKISERAGDAGECKGPRCHIHTEGQGEGRESKRKREWIRSILMI